MCSLHGVVYLTTLNLDLIQDNYQSEVEWPTNL